MNFLRSLYRWALDIISNYAAKDIGNVVVDLPDFNDFSFAGDHSSRQDVRIRDLENTVRKYESDLAVSRRETEELRNLSQYLKVQNREANHKRFVAEKRVGAFDVFMRDRVCNLIENGVNPLNGEQTGCYVFVDRHGNVVAMSDAAHKFLGYDESRPINYRELVPAKSRLELAEIKTKTTLDELSLKMVEGENISVKEVHVSPLLVGGVYAGTVVDFRGLTLLEKARTAWLESRARKLIDETRVRFKEKGIDLDSEASEII